MDLLDKMMTFVRVVETGSFSAAAKQLRISAAAVSRQMSTLEREVGSTLLQRTTRRMVITPRGSRYYDACRSVLERVEEANAVGKKNPLAGVLRVSAPVSYGLGAIVPRLPGLLRLHKSLQLELRLEDSLVDLAFEGVDVAIRVGTAPPDSADIISQPLASFRRVVVASPKYLSRRGIPKTPEALSSHDVITGSPLGGTDSWTLVRGDEEERRVSIKPVLRSNALIALHTLVLEGFGLAVFPQWFVAKDLKRGTLRRVLPLWQSRAVSVQALHRVEHRGALRVRAFIDYLRSTWVAVSS